LLGIGVGLGFNNGPLLLSELAPPNIRGGLVSYSGLMTNFGIFIGYVTGYVLSN